MTRLQKAVAELFEAIRDEDGFGRNELSLTVTTEMAGLDYLAPGKQGYISQGQKLTLLEAESSMSEIDITEWHNSGEPPQVRTSTIGERYDDEKDEWTGEYEVRSHPQTYR